MLRVCHFVERETVWQMSSKSKWPIKTRALPGRRRCGVEIEKIHVDTHTLWTCCTYMAVDA